jgi:hypothetical protein
MPQRSDPFDRHAASSIKQIDPEKTRRSHSPMTSVIRPGSNMDEPETNAKTVARPDDVWLSNAEEYCALRFLDTSLPV